MFQPARPSRAESMPFIRNMTWHEKAGGCIPTNTDKNPVIYIDRYTAIQLWTVNNRGTHFLPRGVDNEKKPTGHYRVSWEGKKTSSLSGKNGPLPTLPSVMAVSEYAGNVKDIFGQQHLIAAAAQGTDYITVTSSVLCSEGTKLNCSDHNWGLPHSLITRLPILQRGHCDVWH